MKIYGLSIYFWMFILVLVIFSNYIGKTIYGFLYKIMTGSDIDPKYYTLTRYGQPDYNYMFGKAIFRI